MGKATGAELAEGLSLAGRPLQPPNFVNTGWKVGQKFTAEDDPDRTSLPWAAPSFISRKDPTSQKTWAEELPISSKTGFARLVHGALDEEDCAELVQCINQKGFTPALLNIGGGRQRLEPEARDGWRAIVDCEELGGWLLEALRPHLPEIHQDRRLVDLNGRCRILCYTPGQEFGPHYDATYTRPRPDPRAGDCSLITVQLYLHDVPEGSGGETAFLGRRGEEDVACQPRVGSVLIFTQNLLHAGCLLKKGLKYTLRTEAMYRHMTA
ncbi:unnamed protein product [Effrenium voratum]|nr:unnamed protein product [Effrenium voratum]